MTIVAIGKSSFLAQEIKKNSLSKEWLFLSHQEALSETSWLDKAHILINFSFPPHFRELGYDTQSDIDRSLALLIDKRPIHYIMLSSRMVYGQSPDNFSIKENQKTAPNNLYAEAKEKIEKTLQSILKTDGLTILRLANIFGLEYGRTTFFGRMINSLIKEKKIIFDMSAETKRDFLPVDKFSDVLMRITSEPKSGIYNVGSGFGTECSAIANWLIDGYGQGQLEVLTPLPRDQFSLDVSKLQRIYSVPIMTPALLKDAAISYGKKLKELSING